MSRMVISVILVASLAVNVLLLAFWIKNRSHIQASNDFVAAEEKYPLLSKRILSEFPQDILINFLDLRRQLRTEVIPFEEKFGFYFEYLPTGTSIGVNEKIEFHAASLFKVPVVMAYYHGRERLKETGDPMLVIKEEHIDRQFGNLWEKGVGAKIKASEAVQLTLTESDNTAVKLLVPFVTKADFDAVYEALDVDLQTDQEGALISAKNYSSILKALYFSSVLNKESSQEILDLLTKTKFPDKLAAGVPTHIPIAHKIGDFIDKDNNEGFRDCGIVYVPRRPYVLCMFSVGDEQMARERMQRVSKMVYEYVAHAEK